MDKINNEIAKIWKKQPKLSDKKIENIEKHKLKKLHNNNNTNIIANINNTTDNNINNENEINLQQNDTTISHDDLGELSKFCDYLDDVLVQSKNVLNSSYQKQTSSKLIPQLKANVAELLCIQKEIKTIIDNTQSLKAQIAAVKINADEQKSKLKTLKNEERRTRFFLNSELKHNKPSRFSTEVISNRRFSIATSATTVTPSSTNRPATISPLSDENRFVKITNRNLLGPLRKSKLNRSQQAKKNNGQDSCTSYRNTGVTLLLNPINEIEKIENSNSSPSTPNPSIGNIPWLFDNSSPSETTTVADSIISDTNSLSVVNSEETVEEVD